MTNTTVGVTIPPGDISARSFWSRPFEERDLHLTARHVIQVNNFIHGVHAMPVAWTP